MTMSPEPWRLGAELVRLCLLAAGLAVLVHSAPALSDRGGARSDAGGDRSGRISDVIPASRTTPIESSISRDPFDADDDGNDVEDGHHRDVREPRSVSIDAAGTATWRVTALGIDPASFLYPRTHSQRAPPQ